MTLSWCLMHHGTAQHIRLVGGLILFYAPRARIELISSRSVAQLLVFVVPNIHSQLFLAGCLGKLHS